MQSPSGAIRWKTNEYSFTFREIRAQRIREYYISQKGFYYRLCEIA